MEQAPLYPNLIARENPRVRTTLIGLPEERIEELLDTSRANSDGKHFGLGLAIAPDVAFEHGGRLELSNREDEEAGACATVVLPLPRAQVNS